MVRKTRRPSRTVCSFECDPSGRLRKQISTSCWVKPLSMLCNELSGFLCRISIIPIDHDEIVRIAFAEQSLNGVPLASSRLRNNFGAVRAGDVRGPIMTPIVNHQNARLRKDATEIKDDGTDR